MASSGATSDTRRYWRVLRNALLPSTDNEACGNNPETTASSISTDFFPQYPKLPVDNAQLLLLDVPPQENFVWVAYDLSSARNASTGKEAEVYVHEKRQEVRKVSIAELLSHQVNHGVDNTGNIRTWPSEQILLSYLLSSDVCSQIQQLTSTGKRQPLACCELGSGMTGLASLGLLACAPVELQRVTVTDGNPLCVNNLKRCVEANKAHQVFADCCENTTISTELLRWDRTAGFDAHLHHQFDLVFACDCLFFEEFHEDLAYTIKNLLRRGSGCCLLLQPSRNGSMERFCTVAERHGFQIHQSRDYDPAVARKHAEYVQTRSNYVPDVHFPVLLTLTLSQT